MQRPGVETHQERRAAAVVRLDGNGAEELDGREGACGKREPRAITQSAGTGLRKVGADLPLSGDAGAGAVALRGGAPGATDSPGTHCVRASKRGHGLQPGTDAQGPRL